MDCHVLDLQEIDATQVALAGGKGAQLGELSRIAGISVPDGICVTASAFAQVVRRARPVDERLARLATLRRDDADGIRALSAELRHAVTQIPIPGDLAAAITERLGRFGPHSAFAVRSSATAEDRPTSSFAGQHDSYLNVVGMAAVLEHISRCWASLFTERAVTYRLRNDLHDRDADMAVVVQQMVPAHAAGVLFTADPMTGHRRVSVVEATVGLGEALVSGRVSPDVFKVRDGVIVAREISAKPPAVLGAQGGGTREQPVAPGRGRRPALTDAQVIALAQAGRRIEAHFGAPQDIEWCMVAGECRFVQSRPITTLFPVPAAGDPHKRVYLSVGHQQMMTDPMKPLGYSMWQQTAFATMYEAGGRLFVDVGPRLASSATREAIVDGLGKHDPLIGDALRIVLERGDLLPPVTDAPAAAVPGTGLPPIETDPVLVSELIVRSEASIAALERDISQLSGPAVFAFIRADGAELRRTVFDVRSQQAIMAGLDATAWLNDHLEEWLGVKNLADTLSQSAPHNVTSEMGLALLDVADVVRAHPAVVDYLTQAPDDGVLDDLVRVPGGPEARKAIQSFLDRYGMRCVGEIDVTRPRWSEQPAALVPMILSNVANFEAGAAQRQFAQGLRQAAQAQRDVLARVRALPGGEDKATDAKRMIDRVRTFIGYREYPKYSIVNRYWHYKQALLREADRLARSGAIAAPQEAFYLTFDEFEAAVRTGCVDAGLVDERRRAFAHNERLTPPRVLTSDGEIITGTYRRDGVPAGALVGLAVSTGVIEGRARVIPDLSQARLEPGDILVTAFTDPSWAPVFVAVSGLVTEVGGLMTHGAVIAREYGLPAVVGVEQATTLIGDGQWIRVHGTDGYVEILPAPPKG